MIDLKGSMDDFEQYKKDLILLVQYIQKVGDISLPGYTAEVSSSRIGGDPGIKCFRFSLSKIFPDKFFNRNKEIISFAFVENKDGNIFVFDGYGNENVNYSTQSEFIEFMSQLEMDLSVRSQSRNKYEDSAKAFRELMKNES